MKKKRESRSRRTSKKPVRVFSFGVHALDAETTKIVNDQLSKGHQYRNVLCRIEIDRRESYRKIQEKLSPLLKELGKQYEEISEQYYEARKKLGGRNKLDVRAVYISKAEFNETAEAAKVRKIEAQLIKIGKAISKERRKVTKTYFTKADKEFRRRKEAMGLKYLAEHDPTAIERPEEMTNEDFKKLKKSAIKKLAPQIKKRFPSIIRTQMFEEDKWPEVWKEKEKYEQLAGQAKKKARKECGCGGGTYLEVENAADQSFKDSIFNPAFKHFELKGLVGVQVPKIKVKSKDATYKEVPKVKNKDVTLKEAFSGENPNFQLKLCPEIHIRGYDRAKRKFEDGRRKEPPPRAVMAIIKLKGRKEKDKVYIRVPFLMHREFPADTVFKWIMLRIDHVGTRPIYQLQFTIESDTFTNSYPRGEKVLAIREGWRLLDDGSLQVAVTEDGRRSVPLLLPPDMLGEEVGARMLLSYSDKLFGRAHTFVSNWFKEDKERMKITEAVLDEWHKAKEYYHASNEKRKSFKQSFPLWQAHGKMATLTFALCAKYTTQERIDKLWAEWKTLCLKPVHHLDLFEEKGKDGFSVLPAWFQKQGVRDPIERFVLCLEWWHRKDKHLFNTAKRIIQRLKLRRRDIYRAFAASKAKEGYATIVIGKWDKQKTAKKPKPEDDIRTQREEAANALRQFCGVSVLDGALKHVFGKGFVEILASKVSNKHYGCGGTSKLLNGDQHGICSKCGRQYDHDANAARQLLAKYFERSNGAEKSGSARKTKDKAFQDVANI